jgi:ATP-binding cassette, subfamily F, member 3
MIAISFANVSLVLGGRAIFRSLSWEIQHDQRVGLIGPNGSGKSSLLKMIVSEYSPEPGGTVVRARGISLGYLPQEPALNPKHTAFEAALSGGVRMIEVRNSLTRLEAKLAERAVFENPKVLARTLEQQQRLLEEYEALGGDGHEGRVRELLRGLGLSDEDCARPVPLLSGGQKKLVGLASLLLARPSVLLLDEPDNHLDLAGKTYLEKLIRDYAGAVVLISHDRYLLDAVVTHIAEIEDGRLTTFAGDYTTYVADKQERLARQEELFQVQQREIARLEAARKRYALWTMENDKFASRARAMEARIARIERIERPSLERQRMQLGLNGWRGSNKVLEMTGVSKSFGENGPLRNINLLLQHGDRVGLVGANGAGKSVLLRIITQQVAPDAGEVKVGPSVRLGYYSQEHETLNLKQTALEAVRGAGYISEERAVAFLKRYLFTYQQATQKIGEFSGGERSRLQLALLVLSGANFLLLDEPTNNLDIVSAEVLEEALEDFEGTVLVISHDRYFLDRTVERILELESGTLTEYIGGYADYAERKKRLNVS